MLFLIALASAAVVGLIIWRTMGQQRDDTPETKPPTAPRRVVAPDDDPDFLRQLDERLRSDGDDPPRRR